MIHGSWMVLVVRRRAYSRPSEVWLSSEVGQKAAGSSFLTWYDPSGMVQPKSSASAGSANL